MAEDERESGPIVGESSKTRIEAAMNDEAAIEVVEMGPGDERLSDVGAVMAELREGVGPGNFAELFENRHAEGYRLAALLTGGACRAVAGYRVFHSFAWGHCLYVDDLVTAAGFRGRGYGRRLNDHLLAVARERGCQTVALDSGLGRPDAHRFYFREGYAIASFRFGRRL